MSAIATLSEDIAGIKSQFQSIFGSGGKLEVVRSPGRVNLIGEHTDYNDGFVFPMAIEPHVTIVFRKRDDGRVRLASTVFPKQVVEFSVKENIVRGEPSWANYSKGIAAELKGAGVQLSGMDALLSNTLPVGGGLSSSAALEVGTGRALLHLINKQMDFQELALLSQKAEHEYALVPCGIMDQTIVAGGRSGYAMLLDCRDLSKKYVPIDGSALRVVIINSMVHHELSGGEYAKRRSQCEAGVAYFQKSNPKIKALRDVTLEQVVAAQPELGDLVFRRCRHVVTEIARTTEAAEQLTARNFDRVGELMVDSHNSLRDDYEVSTPELDYLVEQAMGVDGVYGARMTGGGFGGCIVALTRPEVVETLAGTVTKAYSSRFKKQPVVIVTTACDGAAVIDAGSNS